MRPVKYIYTSEIIYVYLYKWFLISEVRKQDPFNWSENRRYILYILIYLDSSNALNSMKKNWIVKQNVH